jgi:hypothetical protein
MGQEFSENLLTAPECFNNFRAQSLGRERAKRAATLNFFRRKSHRLRAFCRYRATGKRNLVAHVAQLAEHVLGKDEVIGSIPIMGSRRFCGKQLNRKKLKQEISNGKRTVSKNEAARERRNHWPR